MVEFTWKTQSNDVLKVVAHSSSSGVVRQYDLWINGVLFSQLFTLTELMRRNRETVKAIETAKQSSDPRRRNDSSDNSMGSVSSSPLEEMGVPSSVRLSMAGLHSESADDDDELRSELYSSALDEIRLSVTSYLPQTEDMISRAIVEVFISEEDAGHSSSSSLYVPSDKECCHHEVNALYETLEWTRLHNKDASREGDHDEMVLAFLQKQIMNTIRQIRKEQISSQAAIRILVGVAALLDLPLVRPMVQGTVLLEGCGRDCTGELRDFLSRFGIVEWCSVSRKNPTFACCRFAEETSVVALLEAVRDNQQVPKNLAGMSFTALSSNSARSRTSTEDLTSSSEHCDDDDSQDGPLLTKPDLIKSVSHDTASSTCASLCSMYSHHFLLEG